MANEIEIRVSKVKPGPVFDQFQREAKTAGKDIEDSLQKGFKGAEQASDRARKGIGDNLDKTAKAAGDAGEKAGANFSERLGGSLEGAGKAGAAAAGVAIGALLMDGLAQSFEEKKVGGLLAAQTGATSEAAGQLGHIAGDIFTDNFGGSIAEVGEAMKAVFDNRLIDKNANEADIKAVTEAAMTAAQVVGESVNSVARAAQQLVRTGLADNVTEALDMITHASQEGLNASEDLLDTITEYSTKFRDLGLNGEEAFGLMSQAVRAGARDTDTAADALKEFAIKAIDGSATTERGFKTIGLSAETMGQAIAAGGNSARAALGETFDGLQRIHDPILRNQVAVDLFGTKAEDLGDALEHMNLDTAADEFGEFSKAAQDAANKVAEATPQIETLWKNLQAGMGKAMDLATDSNPVKEGLRALRAANAEAESSQKSHEKAVRDAADAWKNQGGQIEFVIESLDKYISKTKQIADGVIDLSEAQIAYQAALDDAAAALLKNKANLDLNTEAGRANQSALNDLADTIYGQIEAMEQQGATAEELAQFMGGARESFVALAIKMGLSAQQANELANKLRLIPGDYTARVNADTTQAASAITTIHNKLVDLTNRQWIASVAVTGAGAQGGGRYYPGLAAGGPVGGPVGHAAEGGARGSRVLVGELGPEVVDLAPGSAVHPAGDSARMMAGGRGSGEYRIVFDFRGATTPMEMAVVETIRKAVKVQGGNVQTVLGP